MSNFRKMATFNRLQNIEKSLDFIRGFCLIFNNRIYADMVCEAKEKEGFVGSLCAYLVKISERKVTFTM